MEDEMPGSSTRDAVMLFIKEKKLGRAIADACQIDEASIRQWRRVPPLRVIEVERITGIPRHLIRPDVFPSPDQLPEKDPTNGKPSDRERTVDRKRTGRRPGDRKARRRSARREDGLHDEVQEHSEN
jgi:hypothetical protein